MSIYEFKSYQKIIKNLVEQHQTIDSGFNFQKLAERSRIQKTYLSKVVNGKAELSRDQCFAVAEVLGLNDSDTDYLLLVHDFNRTALKHRKQKLENQIVALQNKQLDSKNVLQKTQRLLSTNSARYYLHPEHLLVHVALGIPAYMREPGLLVNALGIPEDRLTEILLSLEEMGIIQLKGKQVQVLVPDLHLSKESPWYKPWLELIRTRSLARLNHIDPQKVFAFSATFTCSLDAFQKIKVDAMEFIKNAKATTEQSRREGMFQINLDLFPWL